MFDQQNHATGGPNGSITVGMFVCLCLPSKKPSEREIFVPSGMDLDVKLLIPKSQSWLGWITYGANTRGLVYR
jgi:hypothetical protein